MFNALLCYEDQKQNHAFNFSKENYGSHFPIKGINSKEKVQQNET